MERRKKWYTKTKTDKKQDMEQKNRRTKKRV